MESSLVVGILNIVEDKLREFGIMLPVGDRYGSEDPIVGYHYAELHDRIKEYLEEEGLIKPDGSHNLPVDSIPEDLRRIFVLTCLHEHKHGADCYGSVHPSYVEAQTHVDIVQQECDLDEEDDREFFSFDIDEKVVDVARLKPVQPILITGIEMDALARRGENRLREQATDAFKSLDSQISFAEASKAPEGSLAGDGSERANRTEKKTPEI